MRTIFLDVDGVLCDFAGTFCRHHGMDVDDVFPPGHRGDYEFNGKLGMTAADVWQAIDRLEEEHWAEMEPYPWAQEMFAACNEIARTVLLTTPSLHHGSAAGKHRWITRHFGPRFRDFLIGLPKEACAHREAVLVDDFQRNCDKFAEAGGHVVMFPRPWNDLYHVVDPVGYAVARLKAIKEGT